MTSGKSIDLSRYSVTNPTKTDAIKKVGTLREELQALIDLDNGESMSLLAVNRNLFSWFSNSVTLYDGRTVFLIAANFFSEGAMFMICLMSTLMYRDTFHLEPGMATLHLAAICLPEGLIFFFSVISDTVTLFGSPRRGYIILMSLMMIGLSVLVANYHFSPNQPELFTLMVALIVFTRAWLAPIVESLMVIQIKKDPDYGAEDLETFGTFATALGQVFYCILGGWMMFWSNETKPEQFFYLIAATGIVLLFGGLIYPTESDDISPHYAAMSTWLRLKTKLQLFTEAIELPEIKRILFFFLIVSIVAPNLEEFLIYYNAGQLVNAL